MSPEPYRAAQGCTQPLLSATLLSRAEENHLLTHGGWARPPRVPVLPFSARAMNYPQNSLSCWAVVSTRRVLTGHFQLIRGTAEHHFGLTSEAKCCPEEPFKLAALRHTAAWDCPQQRSFIFKKTDWKQEFRLEMHVNKLPWFSTDKCNAFQITCAHILTFYSFSRQPIVQPQLLRTAPPLTCSKLPW